MSNQTQTQTSVNSSVTSSDLNAIAAERKAWEIGAYRTSNTQLYAILAKSLSFYVQLDACTKKTDAMRVVYDSFVDSNKIKFKKTTNLVSRVVKCVFFEPSLDKDEQCDRRRISAYATVLQRAIADKVSADNLPTWIDENGGVEQIRLNKANTKTATQKAEVVRKDVETSANYIAVFESAALLKNFNSIDYDKAFVAVIVPRGDGKIEVRYVVKAEGAVNASLASMYAETVAASTLSKTEKIAA
jgi:hypothetical protein